jgi:hypothetical protein
LQSYADFLLLVGVFTCFLKDQMREISSQLPI